jgi:Hypervirulence associated proteins TUDOR domain
MQNMTDDKLHKGDRVTWRSHGSTTEGEVIEEITEDTKTAGRTVRASQEDPQYRVRSDKTGKDAVHKAGALRKQ